MKYDLRIPIKKISYYKSRYDFDEGTRLEKFHGTAQAQGFITALQLHEICHWKSKRRADLAKNNPESLVRELSKFSFSAINERAKLGSLTLLDGVQFPTASVILHFCLDQSYPILDVRALWTLSIEKPAQYTFSFWERYVDICRELAAKNSISVRDLDMALWQFSKENQS